MSRNANVIATVPRTRGWEGLCSWRYTLGIPRPPLKSRGYMGKASANLHITPQTMSRLQGFYVLYAPTNLRNHHHRYCILWSRSRWPDSLCVRVHHTSSQKCMLTCCSGIFTQRPRQAAPETEQHNDTSC